MASSCREVNKIYVNRVAAMRRHLAEPLAIIAGSIYVARGKLRDDDEMN